ncbi:MAG: hypothetical protein P1U74_03170 [Legionellaceae bacterium]|nr:hypothetical protein [Legionellaceae bacterium]
MTASKFGVSIEIEGIQKYSFFKLNKDLRVSYTKDNSSSSYSDIERRFTPHLKDKKSFYSFSSSNRFDLKHDFDLLDQIANNKSLLLKHKELVVQIKYYRLAYEYILLQDGILADNFDAIAKYKRKEKSALEAENAWYYKILKDLQFLSSMIFHTSMMQKFLNQMNRYRVIAIFSRFTWINIWSMVDRLGYLDKNSNLDGFHIDQESLKNLGFVFGLYSIAIYGLRVLMVLGLVFRHVFIPSEAEQCRNILERLWLEIKKHGGYFVNDSAKVIISIMITFPEFCHILGSQVPYLTGLLLLLDLVKWICHFVDEYVTYNQAKSRITSSMESLSGDDKSIQKLLLTQLEIQHKENITKLGLKVAFNALMLTSFIIAVTLMPYAAVPFVFMFALLCRAIDINADKFAAYLRARDESFDSGAALEKDSIKDEKLNSFLISSVKTFVIPLVLMGLFVISWQLALVAAAVYLGIEYAHSLRIPPRPKNKSETIESVVSDGDDDSNEIKSPTSSSYW